MRRWTVVVLGPLVSLGAVTAASARSTTSPASPGASPLAWPATCPVTQPNGSQPPRDANIYGREVGDYGNDALWTSLDLG